MQKKIFVLLAAVLVYCNGKPVDPNRPLGAWGKTATQAEDEPWDPGHSGHSIITPDFYLHGEGRAHRSFEHLDEDSNGELSKDEVLAGMWNDREDPGGFWFMLRVQTPLTVCCVVLPFYLNSSADQIQVSVTRFPNTPKQIFSPICVNREADKNSDGKLVGEELQGRESEDRTFASLLETLKEKCKGDETKGWVRF